MHLLNEVFHLQGEESPARCGGQGNTEGAHFSRSLTSDAVENSVLDV